MRASRVASSGGRRSTPSCARRGSRSCRSPVLPRPGPLLRAAVGLRRIIPGRAAGRDPRPQPGRGRGCSARPGARRAGTIPVVSTYHGVLPERIGRAARALAGPTSSSASAEQHADARRRGARPLPRRTIFNSVDPQVRRGRDEVRAEFAADGPLLVTVGRYVAEKNQALLLDALAQMQERPRTLLVGYGPRRQELADRAAALGLHVVTSPAPGTTPPT